MKLHEMIEKLNLDLSREYSHWHFYIHAAAVVTGLHREEFSEMFLKEATGEMQHIFEFKKLILGLGGYPTIQVAPFNNHLTSPRDLVLEALKMEEEVVLNYVLRMDEAEELESDCKVSGRYVHIFLEDQILDSRKAVDNYKEILKGL